MEWYQLHLKLRALDLLPDWKDPAVAVGTGWASKGTGSVTVAAWCFYAEELN